MSEGLSAVYKFETRVGSGSSASQGTNQLYAGLSGGFGSLTLGKFHNAAYNAAGAIRDIGYWYSSGDTASKVGNTVSYAFSSDAASFQVDAIMDGGMDTGRAIDQVQFGVSVNLGDIGKVALGYENVENAMVKEPDTIAYTTVINGKQNVTAGLSGMGALSGMSSLGGTASLSGVSGTISVSDLAGALSGDITLPEGYSISVTDAKVTGNINATVRLTGYDVLTQTGMQSQLERGVCLVYDNPNAAPTNHGVQFQSACTALAEAVGEGTSFEWNEGPNITADDDDTSDYMLANEGVSSSYTSAFVGDIVEGSVMHMIDGEMVERRVVQVPVDANGAPTAIEDPDCSLPYAADAGDGQRSYLCGQRIQYFNTDNEMVSGTLTTTANVALSGETLTIVGGDLVVMDDEGEETKMSIADVLDVDISEASDAGETVAVTVDTSGATIDNSMVTVDHDGVTVDLDGVTVDVNADSLTATTTAQPVKGKPMTKPGYKATHVSVQLNLGAMTLGLGYSEKERNVQGSMDQKTTYVGASGSIGDSGMGWRAWTRDISNEWDADAEEYVDSSPWGIGINKDLGGGAFTFVEHHNADKGKSGNTIVALGVNF